MLAVLVRWALVERLDFFRTGSFYKPRRGVCGLCGRPVIEHPTLQHRWQAAKQLWFLHRNR